MTKIKKKTKKKNAALWYCNLCGNTYGFDVYDKVCTEFAENQGYEVNYICGSTNPDEREATFISMISRILQSDTIDAVFVLSEDRVSRNKSKLSLIKQWLSSNNIDLISVNPIIA